jgi:hypothetical protein
MTKNEPHVLRNELTWIVAAMALLMLLLTILHPAGPGGHVAPTTDDYTSAAVLGAAAQME